MAKCIIWEDVWLVWMSSFSLNHRSHSLLPSVPYMRGFWESSKSLMAELPPPDHEVGSLDCHHYQVGDTVILRNKTLRYRSKWPWFSCGSGPLISLTGAVSSEAFSFQIKESHIRIVVFHVNQMIVFLTPEYCILNMLCLWSAAWILLNYIYNCLAFIHTSHDWYIPFAVIPFSIYIDFSIFLMLVHRNNRTNTIIERCLKLS